MSETEKSAGIAIASDQQVISAVKKLNAPAEVLDMEFSVAESRSHPDMVEIIWMDKSRPAGGRGEGGTTRVYNSNRWSIGDITVVLATLSTLFVVMQTVVDRSSKESEFPQVRSARKRVNRWFKALSCGLTVVFGALSLWAAVADPLQIQHVASVSIAAVVLVWCANEWRLTHRKNTNSDEFDGDPMVYVMHALLRLPLTLAPAIATITAVAYATAN